MRKLKLSLVPMLFAVCAIAGTELLSPAKAQAKAAPFACPNTFCVFYPGVNTCSYVPTSYCRLDAQGCAEQSTCEPELTEGHA